MSMRAAIRAMVCSPVCAPIASLAGAAAPWLPSSLTNLAQRFLDANPGYYASTLQSLPIVTPEETGTVAVPRGARCVLFDGADDYATLGARLTSGSPTALTVTAWIKMTNATAYRSIACEWTGSGNQQSWFLLVEMTTGKLQFAATANGSTVYSLTSSAAVNTGSWVHVAVSYSSSEAKIFINGNDVTGTAATSGTLPASLFNASANFIAGASDAGSFNRWNGSLYDLRAYNVAKSGTEIAAIYNQATAPSIIDRTGLLAHYYCNDESGNTLRDASGNGRHLTITNASTGAGGSFHAIDSGVAWNPANHAGHTVASNLLTYSEQFDHAAWTKESATITANAALAPNGTTSADLVNTSSGGYTAQALTLSGSHVFSCYVKKGGADWALLILQNVTGKRAWFNLASGVVGTQENCTATIQSVGNGWYRCAIFATLTNAASTTIAIATIDGDNSVNPAATNTAYFWGAQLEFGSTVTGYTPTTTTTFERVIIPANQADPTKDVLGNTLGVTGPIVNPATAEVPCFTGDGSAAYIEIGSNWIPPTADFTIRVKYKHATSTNFGNVVVDQRLLVNDASGSFYLGTLFNGYVSGGANYLAAASGSNLCYVASPLTSGVWYDVTVARAGNVLSLTIAGVGTASVNLTGADQTINQSGTTKIGAIRTGASTFGYFMNQAIAELQFTTGGVTKTFPLQEGPGTGNTNRTIYWVGSDGTSGSITNGITGGTVSNIWANRCPYARDHFIQYGGRVASGVAIPGRLSGGLAADGNALTHAAGKHGNPYSRIVPNYWGTPELIRIGYTTATKLAPTDATQSISPADTKFRRTASSGDDRYFATRAALTGTDKTNAEAYVA